MTSETSAIKRNTMATVSFVLGIIGVLGMLIVMSAPTMAGLVGCIGIAAVIVRFIALKQIKQKGEQGKGLAIAGIVLGFLPLFATVLLMIMMPLISGTFSDINSSLGQ